MPPYDPNGEITFLALSKLEILAKIPILAAVEGNLEKFMDTAGFRLVTVRILGDTIRIAYEYIESWRRGKNPTYKPTWSGLLSLLERIELDSLAQKIDSILKKISPSFEQLDEHKDPDNGMWHGYDDLTVVHCIHSLSLFPTKFNDQQQWCC